MFIGHRAVLSNGPSGPRPPHLRDPKQPMHYFSSRFHRDWDLTVHCRIRWYKGLRRPPVRPFYHGAHQPGGPRASKHVKTSLIGHLLLHWKNIPLKLTMDRDRCPLFNNVWDRSVNWHWWNSFTLQCARGHVTVEPTWLCLRSTTCRALRISVTHSRCWLHAL